MFPLLLNGCTLIPELEKSEFPAPPLYPDGLGYDPALMNESTAPLLSDIAWRNFFRNDSLKTLIAIELKKNRDLQTATLAIAEPLSAVSTFDDRVRAQANLVAATDEATRLSQLRYDTGVDNYLTVLGARRELYAVRQGIISLENAKIALYKAVGGDR